MEEIVREELAEAIRQEYGYSDTLYLERIESMKEVGEVPQIIRLAHWHIQPLKP